MILNKVFCMKKFNILPYFGQTLAYTIFYLALIVIIPLGYLIFHASNISMHDLVATVTNPRVLHSVYFTFSIALIVAILNLFLGIIISWTIVRYDFLGKSIIDLFIDLPLALPTAIAGLTLATLYSNDMWLGKLFSKIGLEIAFTKAGIIIALVFVGLPLAIRTIEPAIRDIDPEVDIAAQNLGATNWQIFYKIYLPSFLPCLFSAFYLCFARALCEYGAVIFISSNIPKESEVASLLIYSKIEQFDYNQATLISLLMLMAALIVFGLIKFVNQRVTNG